jgi:hypothetical protein
VCLCILGIDDVQLEAGSNSTVTVVLKRKHGLHRSVPGLHVIVGETRRCEGKDYSR